MTDEDLTDNIENLSIANDFKIVTDKIAVTAKMFEAFCTSLLDSLMKNVEHILARESASGIRNIFITGDSVDEVFVEFLKSRYSYHTIITSQFPGLVRMKGALLYGIRNEYNIE